MSANSPENQQENQTGGQPESQVGGEPESQRGGQPHSSTNATDGLADRRPLASRNTRWAQKLAQYLAQTSITPNQISIGSMVFAAMAGSAFAVSSLLSGALYLVCMLVAIIGCQLRLICNLMDGMVAIEAGKQTRDGAVWNEFPDRIADIAIFVGLGIAVGWPALGWAASALAVLVAYVRELGKGIDGTVDFAGPMAKPQRMALVSIGAMLSAIVAVVPVTALPDQSSGYVLLTVLVVLVAGSVITVLGRARSLLNRLN